jgi:hypothetical protein
MARAAAPAPGAGERGLARVGLALADWSERHCGEDGESWDDAKRECVWLMRAKD